jgi:hypothetical protein
MLEPVDATGRRIKVGGEGGRPAPRLRTQCSTPGRAEVMEILGAAALVHE